MDTAAPTPPPGYAARAPRRDDAETVAALKRAAEEDHRESDVTVGSVLEEWALPNLHLGEDAWLVLAPTGEAAAYAFVFEDAPSAYVSSHSVHPDHAGRGLEEYLLDLTEARAHALAVSASAPAPVTFALYAAETERLRLTLYEERGYAHVRSFMRVMASLERQPPAPQLPAGVVVRAFRKDHDEAALYEALKEAFLDHWRPTVMDYEQWLAYCFASPNVDVRLWWVAWDGEQIAGAIVASTTPLGGYIDELAVRRPWRRRGLARALLLTALEELHRRGLPAVYLGVDTLNPTGAMQLYASVGMRQAGDAHLVYEKILHVP